MAAHPVLNTVKGEQGAGAAKNRLLQAANQFGQSSFTDVGIAQILKEASVQPPTLYHHFGDKEGLFVAWAVSAIDRLGGSIAESREADDTMRSLEAIASTLSKISNPDLLQVLKDASKLERPASREAVVEAVQRAVFEQLYEIFLAAMERGILRRDPVRKVASAFVAYTGVLRTNGSLPFGESPEDAVWLVQRFVQGFGA
jgi:AcrR family transcriptional regulator